MKSDASTPLENLIMGVIKKEKRFDFSLNGLEPEDLNLIINAFLEVHVFCWDKAGIKKGDYSALRRLCQVGQVEFKFEKRPYPALGEKNSKGRRIVLLPDLGTKAKNERRAIEIIKEFHLLEAQTILDAIIGLIERFRPEDVVRYVEKKMPQNLSIKELNAFKKRMGERSKIN